MMKHCDTCREPFPAREAKQRFCCPACKVAFFADERRRALEMFRQRASEAESDAHGLG